jgi:pyruvate dehydrogenase E2 component (dihydrolipoamide acetyltransferase)
LARTPLGSPKTSGFPPTWSAHCTPAIINPPEGAILAVGAILDKPVVVSGQLGVGKRMRLTLSCDHRVMDGAMGARFLADLKATLEAPLSLLA